jgi:hypothetical protein
VEDPSYSVLGQKGSSPSLFFFFFFFFSFFAIKGKTKWCHLHLMLMSQEGHLLREFSLVDFYMIRGGKQERAGKGARTAE